MPIRLMLALVSCLLPTVAECAAPFVESRQGQDRDVSGDIGRLVGTRECYVRRHFIEPLALPIIDDGPRPVWVYPYGQSPPRADQVSRISESFRIYGPSHWDLSNLPILPSSPVHSIPVNTRILYLQFDIAGVCRGDSLVELWVTRDGRTWHLYQNAPHGDSLFVSLLGEGRFGLRVVVHDANGHASPTPCAGEAPQLWVEVDENISSFNIEVSSFLDGRETTRVFGDYQYTDRCAYWEIEPGDVKQVKRDGLHHPCGYIKRIDTQVRIMYK